MNPLRSPVGKLFTMIRRAAKAQNRANRRGLRLEGLEDRTAPATFTVTTESYSNDVTKLVVDANGNVTNSDGSPLSFGQAITAVNSTDGSGNWSFPSPNVIDFDIPGPGIKKIDNAGFTWFSVTHGGTTINGFSQPGSKQNTAALGDPINAKIMIEFPIRAYLTSNSNTIEGMSLRGVDMDGNSVYPYGDSIGNEVEGCFLGVRADGKTSWGDDQEGVYLGPDVGLTRIGNGGPDGVNLIAGHTGVDPTYGAVANGMFIDGASDNTIDGNYIGTDLTGAHSDGNSLSGIRFNGSTAQRNSIENNYIAFNGDYAVRVDGGSSNSFFGNSMFSNGKDGVFLAAGANNDAPAPVLTEVANGSITGTLEGASAGTPFTLEVFSSTSKDGAGNYEGKKSLGTFQIKSSPFTIDVDGLTGYVTATATDSTDDTSVFSNAIKAAGASSKPLKDELDVVAAPGEADWTQATVTNGTTQKETASSGTDLVKIEAVSTTDGTAYPLGDYVVPAGQTMTLNPGQSKTIKVPFKLADLGDADVLQPGEYVYRATFDSSWGGKVSKSASPFDFEYEFGNVDGVPNVTATVDLGGGNSLLAADGTEEFSLAGGGTGQVSKDADGNTNISFADTTIASKATAADLGGLTGKIHNIDAPGDIGTVDFDQLDADGTLSFGGALKKLVLHNFGGSGSRLSLTGKDALPELDFHSIRDGVIDGTKIGQLNTGEWVSGGYENTLSANFIGSINVKPTDESTSGDFVPDVAIQQSPAGVYAVGSVSISGTVHDSTWTWTSPTGDTGLAFNSIDIGAAQNWSLVAKNGRVDSLLVHQDLQSTRDPTIQADTIRSLEIDGTLNAASITLGGAEPKTNAAIENLKLGTVQGLTSLTAAQGGIMSLSTANWNAATAIQTKWIERLSSASDFAANLELTGGSPISDNVSLQWTRVKGVLSGTWKLFGNVGPVAVGGAGSPAASWTFLGGQGQNSPGTALQSLTSKGDLLGAVTAQAIGNIVVPGAFAGSLTLTKIKTIPSITIGTVLGSITTPGDIGKITAGSWGNGDPETLSARFVKHLLILGKTEETTFNLAQGAVSFIVGSMDDCAVNAAGQTISVFKVRGVKGDSTPYFTSTKVTAGTLGLVLLNDVDQNHGPAYGITADFVAAYSRFVNGKAVMFTVDGKKTAVLFFPPAGVEDQAGQYSLTIVDGGKPPPA
jgi:hypothetical protein